MNAIAEHNLMVVRAGSVHDLTRGLIAREFGFAMEEPLRNTPAQRSAEVQKLFDSHMRALASIGVQMAEEVPSQSGNSPRKLQLEVFDPQRLTAALKTMPAVDKTKVGVEADDSSRYLIVQSLVSGIAYQLRSAYLTTETTPEALLPVLDELNRIRSAPEHPKFDDMINYSRNILAGTLREYILLSDMKLTLPQDFPDSPAHWHCQNGPIEFSRLCEHGLKVIQIAGQNQKAARLVYETIENFGLCLAAAMQDLDRTCALQENAQPYRECMATTLAQLVQTKAALDLEI